MGNSRARAVYEALLSDNFRRPQTDSGLESFIRSKYEQKKYIAREWIPPPFPPKVDWDKEIEEELENQKRKKKSNSSTSSIPDSSSITKPIASNLSAAAAAANVIPAPLPKPHSPKNSRLDIKKNPTSATNNINNNNNINASSSLNADLLGLDTNLTPPSTNNLSIPANNAINSNLKTQPDQPSLNDTFDFFSDPIPPSATNANSLSSLSSLTSHQQQQQQQTKIETKNGNSENSLKQQEDDFFNQKSLENGLEKGKMTKDSILALYGNMPAPQFQSAPQTNQSFNANFQPQSQLQDAFFFGQNVPSSAQPMFNTHIPPQQQQQQQQQSQQFMPMFAANFGSNVGFNSVQTVQSQQINKLNEENIIKIKSLNFNNFK
jgi:stromal membrane-associated protein